MVEAASGKGGEGARFQARAGLISVVGLLYASACGGPYGTEDYIVQTGPGLLILLTAICFNAIGDGLRDALDPRMRDR